MSYYTYSVIIPAYNRAAFLSRCLSSVMAQDCVEIGSIEALVIDDGSTDGTKQIVETLSAAEKRHTIKYVKIIHVGEPGTVRNVGLKMAQGEYVAYCDSDDYWLPHHLATAAQAFRKDTTLGMVSNYWGLAQFVLEGGTVHTHIQVPPHPIWAVNTNCRVHKTECIGRVGFFNTQKWGEDQDFFLRVEKAYPSKKTGIVTSINGYIKGGNNLTFEFDQGVKAKYF